MITKPTVSQMLRTARREMLENVAPHVADQQAQITLGMIGTILHVAAERAEHQLSWMRSEAEEIERAAASALAEGIEDEALHRAHQAYLEHRSTGVPDPQDAQADYDRASEMLSCLVEASLRSRDQEHAARAKGLLDSRLQRELQMIGDSFYGVAG